VLAKIFFKSENISMMMKQTGNLVCTKKRTNKTNADAFVEKCYSLPKHLFSTMANLVAGFLSKFVYGRFHVGQL